MKRFLALFPLSCLFLFFATTTARAEESTWVYAVQVSATVQASPAQIMLHWPQDDYGANSYHVYRKAKDDTKWGSAVNLSGTTTNYTDTSVSLGQTYEYKVMKNASLGYSGYGYIYAGINADLTESRGKLVLIVATNSTVGLDTEMARLQADLAGDGWEVLRHNVSSNDTPAHVRSIITNDYHTDPSNVKMVFLFGHVPVLNCGNLNYDGHQARPMPADAYYGDMDGNWTTNTEYIPSDIELMVGRVDLANMPGVGSPIQFGPETELLRNYLNKDHNWRHNLTPVQRKAVMANRRGDEGGLAVASDGYRTFETSVGPGNTVEANTEDNAPTTDRWIGKVSSGSYLWSYGCGGGQRAAISELGTNGQYFDVWSTDIVAQDSKAVFCMFFGSWFGNWDGDDDLMRAVLTTPTMGLTCCMAGQPHWFFHHMALGETIGYSTRLSMNNTNLYLCQSNAFARANFIALMGDPSLRMDPVTPPAGLSANSTNGNIVLTWNASSDTVVGYNVYRGASTNGSFGRVNSSIVTGTTFSDSTGTTNDIYMVRAVKLQSGASGTYYNPSQGIFSAVTTSTTVTVPQTIHLLLSKFSGAVQLNWNTQAGSIYHVQMKNLINDTNWINWSGAITASSTTVSFLDSLSVPQRFYRITSP